ATVDWPITVSLDVAGIPSGEAMVEAVATDVLRTIVGRGTASLVLPATGPIDVALRCESLGCSGPQPDGGAGGVGGQTVDAAAAGGAGGAADAAAGTG